MTYTCEMHEEIKKDRPGNCPKCGMKLILKEKLSKTNNRAPVQYSYQPLLIIISLIILTTLILSFKDIILKSWSLPHTMSYFMAGFFLVFSGFKLIDLKGFSEGYSTYDLLAQKLFWYGYIYPFIELLLGICYLTQFTPYWLNILGLLVMTFSGIGVAIKVAKHEKFQCACLGTFLKVPLTKITLIEDFGMALMALGMLLIK